MPTEIPRSQLTVRRETAVLVSVELPNRSWNEADPLEEIRGLAESAGAIVVGGLTQRRQLPETATYIGKGKVDELTMLVKALDADVIIFDNDLSSTQTRNLEKATSVKVLDRSELIMDIFATRARTTAARLQVELAQLEYSLPRLRNMWTHLSRYKGGIGLRGPGETQLEEDRRLVDLRIRDLKAKLREVQGRKEREVDSRAEEMTVSLVGYTNAGKSTLMNALTGAGVVAADKLFATLDTRTRVWKIKDWGRVLLSATVGFIRDLPHRLIASFKATLEEARQAKLLLHVVDASSPMLTEQVKAVNQVLKEIGCADHPTLLVLNKIDRAVDALDAEVQANTANDHALARLVCVSARTGQGLDQLSRAVTDALGTHFVETEIETAAANGRLL
ncbi:MAG TPA: GTPase HflX, partial [Gemmatales bacterium]|nr:GTPase HflX [Gemmatales bacterium]